MANKNNQRKAPKFNFYWMYGLIIVFLLSMLWMNQEGTAAREVSWTQFQSIVSKGGVKSVTVYRSKNKVEALLTDSLAREMSKSKTQTPTANPLDGMNQTAADKVSAQIPSADKFDDYVNAWREQGSLWRPSP